MQTAPGDSLESAGGSAEFPESVTPDYAKSIRLDLVATDVPGCAEASELSVVLSFTSSASSFHPAPDKVCEVCAL